MKRIESLLNREIGLSPRSIGSSAVEVAVNARLRACRLSALDAYVERLERDPAERKALVEEIVVPETWFFRDEEVFAALGRHALGWHRRERPLRVLSLPCATGEEAYSVSITLLEAGLKPERFQVRGVDVSEKSLADARRGVYGKISFRGSMKQGRQSYFVASAEGQRIDELPRQAVEFALGNVLDSRQFAARSFDVILCRNLLIYLDLEARARALGNLYTWLADDGLLFAGHAEAIELMDARFERQADSSPFSYLKQAAKPPAQPRHSSRPQGGSRPRTSTRPAARGKTPAAKQVAAKVQQNVDPSVALSRATELADAGKLGEARQLCEQVLSQHGANADAYCLLGIIHNAADERDNAITCFNKALYLNQSQYEALVHLALIYEQRGELPAAANFRRRAERARRGQGE